MTIDRPELWWPRALGRADAPRPPRRASCSTRARAAGRPTPATCARACGRCAFDRGSRASTASASSSRGRTTARRGWRIAEATPEELARDVELACEAGLDLLRIHAHITRPGALRRGRRGRPAPLAGPSPAVGVRPRHPQAGGATGHGGGRPPRPPSVDRGVVRPQRADGDRERPRHVGRSEGAAPHGGAGRRRAGAADVEQDGARPLREASTGEGGRHPTGDRPQRRAPPPAAARRHRQPPLLRLVPRSRARLPRVPPGHARMARFVTEFGAQAVPTDADFCEPERWPDLDWERLGRTHALQRSLFDRHVPPDDHATFDAWRAATQAYQATVVRRHIEALRRIKYRPTGGFAQFCFADGHPAVTWSVLGHDRAPKAAYEALRDACRPVIVVADRLPEEVDGRPGARARRARGERPASAARRRRGHRAPAVERRQPHLAVAGRHPRRRGASGSGPCRSSCRKPRDRSPSTSTAGTAASRWTTATRRRSSDRPGP